MKKFLLKLLLFISLSFLLFISLISSFSSIFLNHVDFSGPENNPPKIIVLGDSQTETGIRDSMMEGCINLSSSGDHFFFNYVKLKRIISQGVKPETIIMGFSPNNLYSKGFYEVPKMKNKVKAYLFLLDIEDIKIIASYNPIGLFKGLIGSIFYYPKKQGFWKKTKVANTGIGAYRKLLSKKIKKSNNIIEDKVDSSMLTYDPLTIEKLKEAISLCDKHGIRLILLNTPNQKLYSESICKEHKNFIDTLQGNFEYLDYADLSYPDYYFFDGNHLNNLGSIAFTDSLKKRIFN